MLDWSTCSAAERHPHTLSGAWVFRGTRVPLVALFENLQDDQSLSDFLRNFPGVHADLAKEVLAHAALADALAA